MDKHTFKGCILFTLNKYRNLHLLQFTIYLLQGDLAKNVQIRAVQGSAKHPVNPWVIGVEKSLGGNAVRNEPHTEEKEEEENVLHL